MISSLTINKSVDNKSKNTKGRVPITSDLNKTLPAALVAGGSYQSISGARTRAAENQLHIAAAVDRRDRLTDGRTNTVPFHRRSPLEPGNAEK